MQPKFSEEFLINREKKWRAKIRSNLCHALEREKSIQLLAKTIFFISIFVLFFLKKNRKHFNHTLYCEWISALFQALNSSLCSSLSMDRILIGCHQLMSSNWIQRRIYSIFNVIEILKDISKKAFFLREKKNGDIEIERKEICHRKSVIASISTNWNSISRHSIFLHTYFYNSEHIARVCSGLIETVHTPLRPYTDARLLYLSYCFIDFFDNNIKTQMLLITKWSTIMFTVCVTGNKIRIHPCWFRRLNGIETCTITHYYCVITMIMGIYNQ